MLHTKPCFPQLGPSWCLALWSGFGWPISPSYSPCQPRVRTVCAQCRDSIMSPLPDTMTPDEGSTYMLVSPVETKLSVWKFGFGSRNAANHFQTEQRPFVHYCVQILWWCHRCLCVHMYVLVCKHICVCTLPHGQWKVFVCNRLQQHHPVWKAPSFSCQLHWRTANTRSSMGGHMWRRVFHSVYRPDILQHWGGLSHMNV